MLPIGGAASGDAVASGDAMASGDAIASGDAMASGRFSAGPCSFEFALNQVRLAPLVVDAGGVGRFVSVGPAPAEDGSRNIELSYRDTQPLAGTQPYWVRVVQVNRAKAWSSPVYVTHPGLEVKK